MSLLLGLVLAAASPAAAPPPAARLPAPAARTIVEADGTRTLVNEVIVDAPAASVWRAVSTPEGWMGWAVPLARMVGEDLLETSYDPGTAIGGPSTIRQLFVARIPGRMIAFRTVRAPEGFPDFDTYARVVNVIELVPLGERRTLVRLTASPYPDTAAGRRLLAFFSRGNAATLADLRRLFAREPARQRR